MTESTSNQNTDSGFRLLIQTNLSGGNATAKVQWCINNELQKRIRDEGNSLDEVRIFLIIATDDRSEERYVFKPMEIQGYISFFRPGVSWVFSQLVWGDIGTATKRFLSKAGRYSYETYYLLWNSDVPELKLATFSEKEAEEQRVTLNETKAQLGEDADIDTKSKLDNDIGCLYWRQNWLDSLYGSRCSVAGHSDPVSVDVDVEFFAKELPPKIDWWVNLGHSTPLTEDCDRRPRMLYAFLLKPFIVGPYLVARSLLILIWWLLSAIFFAQRGFSMKPLLHPFTYKLSETTSSSGSFGSLLAEDEGKNNRKYSHILRIFTPFYLAVIFIILDMVSTLPIESTAFLLLFTGFIVGIAFLSDQIKKGEESSIFRVLDKFIITPSTSYIRTKEEISKELIGIELSCPDRVTSLRSSSHLKKAKFRMLYHDAKSLVCKPLPRRVRTGD